MQPQLFVRNGTSLLIPVPDFKAVEDYRDSGRLSAVGVEVLGLLCICDLTDGSIIIGEEKYEVVHPGEPLRPIYYKDVSFETGMSIPHIDAIGLGWQSTVNGKNVRFGIKLFPDEGRWQLGSDI